MKRVLLLSCAVLTAVIVHAQMLLVEPGADDPMLLRFNPEFIARNHVTSVKGQLWTKRDGRPMMPQDRFFLYRFGDGGRLGYSNNSFGKPGSGIDTASVMYSYGTKGDLLQELHNDINGYYALRMEYDGKGLPVHVTNVRMENLSSDRYRFVEGTSTVISDEHYEYATLNDTTWRKTYLNDRGRPYQEEAFTKDKLGYLREIEMHNLITQRRGRTTFTYDGKGRLAERAEQPDLGQQYWTTWTWTYDTAGNPLTRDLVRNGVLMRHSEYLYAEGTLFMKAIITKNNETGLIDIVRYVTER
ncbi:MAG: hypothetical protein IPO60_17435 [Flavobacteriales bacterium]|jgi:hypothetical protein|nr:hypothetical protein [Flavobacteriales bacterium]MBK6893353.1 hypothetical protein [Flavobacteriales bacterium]MBK7248920.1 hypothetical protein [Flavobacteriales bacterium]MBK7288215.1 hypothetical protein [Flavobacteriales bacterium]MBK9058839.1 hypothetical protein [Flavobacteriales bacterium]